MESNYSDLRGKTALITGCNRGIGKEILMKFALQGVNIVACIRTRTEDFSLFLDSLREHYNIYIEVLLIDLTNSESIAGAMQKIFRQKISVDILVNNAGVAFGGFLSMTSMSKLREVFEINFFSQVLITQYVAKWMQKRKSGVIINMASIAGIDGMAGYTAYGSSKAALIYFTKTLSKELATSGVRVNAVAPGLINTEMAKQMEEKAAEKMLEQNGMRRLGNPTEVADLVLYLSSDSSSFINGQVIRVDGGV